MEKNAAEVVVVAVGAADADADASEDALVSVVAVQFGMTLLGSNALIFEASVEVKLLFLHKHLVLPLLLKMVRGDLEKAF